MSKFFLIIICFFITLQTAYSNVYYYQVDDVNYDYVYYREEMPNNTTAYNNNNARRAGYSIRLVLSGYDDVVLELTSTGNINNDIYLLFAGGIIKQMRRYSNNVYYYVFENYIDLEALKILNDRNIFMESSFKSQLQNDYNYLTGVINNRYYRDRYYKDYNYKYKR